MHRVRYRDHLGVEVSVNRANPVELRKAIELAHAFVTAGIDFVPVPILTQDDKNELAMDVQTRLKQIEKESTQ